MSKREVVYSFVHAKKLLLNEGEKEMSMIAVFSYLVMENTQLHVELLREREK